MKKFAIGVHLQQQELFWFFIQMLLLIFIFGIVFLLAFSYSIILIMQPYRFSC